MRTLLASGVWILGIISATASAQQAELSLVVPPPGSTTISTGERITIEVFVDNILAPTLLRAYQAQLEIVPAPGTTGSLALDCLNPNDSIFIDQTRLDWVFSGVGGLVIPTVNCSLLRVAAVSASQFVPVPEPRYLGTYIFTASPDAQGDFQINFVPIDPVTGATATFLVDQDNLLIPFSILPPTGLTVTVVQRAANDDCVNSLLVSDGVTPFTTENTTTDGPPLPAVCEEGAGLSFGQDVWFDHVASCTGVLTVSTCSDTTNFNTRLAAYGANTPTCLCPTDNTFFLACNDDDLDCPLLVGASELAFSVNEGNCYTIRVGGLGAAEGIGSLTINCAPDLCTNAEPVNVPSSVSGSTENALANDAIGPDCGLGLPDSPGVWYSVIGTGNLMTAQLGPATTFDSRLTVYLGTCAALTCVGDADNIGAGQESVSWCSDLGVEYLILVHGAVGASGSFTLDISDQGCDDGNACTDDSCINGVCVHDPNFDVNTFCCNPTDRTLTGIDDANPCTDDVCNPDTGVVSHPPVPDGPEPACDEGNPCTLDECQSGSCVNIDINTLVCSTDLDCPGDNIPCVENSCECIPAELELVPMPGSLPVEGCFSTGELVTVRVELGPSNLEFISSEPIIGAQFFLEYDVSTLLFNSIRPGAVLGEGSPFALELRESVDPILGTIDYLVGTNFGTSTQSPATVAVITFQAVAECEAAVGYRSGPNGERNLLAALGGAEIRPFLVGMAPVKINGSPPVLALCPSGVTVSSDPGVFTAMVTWPAPTATDSCDPGSLPVVCDPPSGSVFAPGSTPVTCTATDSCGLQETCIFNVTVEPPLLTADVQLSATVAPGPFARCITFDLWDCDAQDESARHATVRETLPFTNGIASAVDVQIPGGDWECITARDELHTLRSTAPDFTTLDFGMHYTAGFVGSRPSGGHWLLGGNLNDDDFIDILDFGVFFPFFLTVSSPDTRCPPIFPHANINGDGVVDLLDLVFVSGNSLQASEPNCCGAGSASATPGPIMAISVNELRRMGLNDLVAADINQDGILDVDDVLALIDGFAPPPPKDGSLRDTADGKAVKSGRLRSPRR